LEKPLVNLISGSSKIGNLTLEGQKIHGINMTILIDYNVEKVIQTGEIFT